MYAKVEHWTEQVDVIWVLSIVRKRHFFSLIAQQLEVFEMQKCELIFLGLFAIAIMASRSVFAASDKPNVLIMFIDDLGRCDVGVDGSSFYETPNMDALAFSGVQFTDFYSGHPVCSPTRASLMTGKVPQRVGITDWIHPGSGVAIPAADTTLGEAFQAQGYQTAYLGKWHLGETDADQPTQHGFEWTMGVNRAGQPASYYYPYRRPAAAAKIYDVPDFEDGQPGDYLTDAITDGAIGFLKQRDQQRPFLICFGHYAVHTPIEPPQGLPQKYKDKATGLFGNTPAATIPAPFDATSRSRQDNPDYAAMMENLDSNVGRLLASLDQLGLRENTIVVFTSDNGGLCTSAKGRPGPTCNLPYRSGKGWTYEGGIRIPTFVSWPAKLKPSVASTPGYTADIYPTLLELCDLPAQPQQHLDGRSLVSVLNGHADASLLERPLMWYYPHSHGSGHRPSAAIRRGNWKLVYYFESKQSELYDLGNDPGELAEIGAQHPQVRDGLQQELLDWIAVTKT